MKKSGAIEEAQANLKTKEAYQKLIENYPRYKVVEIAKEWLKKNEDKREILSLKGVDK